MHYIPPMADKLQSMLRNCPLPEALETIGERWSFLILRNAMLGVTHFEDFQSHLGIARNILANRLTRMVEKGLLSRQVMECDKRRVQYQLTDKGRALAPVMIALRQWAEQWERGRQCSPMLVDRRDGKPVRPVAIVSHDGRTLDTQDCMWCDLKDGDANGIAAEASPRERTI
jgi:DNA-binding HxlR family transcriptional regulator